MCPLGFYVQSLCLPVDVCVGLYPSPGFVSGFVHGFELQLELMLELAHELGAL